VARSEILLLFQYLDIDFKSKKIRVNLNLPIKAEVKAESSDVLKTVDEDRKYVIQATIVR
jgi:cullin 1